MNDLMIKMEMIVKLDKISKEKWMNLIKQNRVVEPYSKQY